jgi:hypothetical protein
MRGAGPGIQEKLGFYPARLEAALANYEVGSLGQEYAPVDYCTVTISLSDPVIVTTAFNWSALQTYNFGPPPYGNPYSFEAGASPAPGGNTLVVFGKDYSPVILIIANDWLSQ